MTQTDTATTIVREIAIKAPATKVFAALTDPDQLVQWWGDAETYQCTKMERDLRVGGTWQTTGVGSDGEAFSVGGVYRAIDPPHAVEFTWMHQWGAMASPSETVVRYELTEHDGVTTLRVTHSGFTDLQERDGHNAGWARVLAWLQGYLE
jgi:uncharacterized protein YndB with AHSA1/START domain